MGIANTHINTIHILKNSLICLFRDFYPFLLISKMKFLMEKMNKKNKSRSLKKLLL